MTSAKYDAKCNHKDYWNDKVEMRKLLKNSFNIRN
jgi:hypothetical protein